MRALLLSLFTLLTCSLAIAQIQNGGFEVNTGMPVSTGEWSLVSDWNNAGSTSGDPDYFHVNGGVGGDLPETPIAIVQPNGGSAVMGFIATGRKGTNKREYLQTQFDAPLVVGEKYYLEFYITNGEVTPTSSAGLGASDLGIHFSTTAPVQMADVPLNETPDFVVHAVQYDREWDRIAFSFTANQPFEYLTMGVFGDDTNKDIQPIEGSNPQIAYYFLDDFHMEVISNEIVEETGENKFDRPEEPTDNIDWSEQFFIPNAFTPNGDGDNDLWRPIVPELSDYKLCIYSRWGELLFTTNQSQMGWDGSAPSGQGVESGMYIWELSFVELDDQGNRIPRSKNGTVNLLR